MDHRRDGHALGAQPHGQRVAVRDDHGKDLPPATPQAELHPGPREAGDGHTPRTQAGQARPFVARPPIREPLRVQRANRLIVADVQQRGHASQQRQDEWRELRQEHADVYDVGPKRAQHAVQPDHGRGIRDLQHTSQAGFGAEADVVCRILGGHRSRPAGEETRVVATLAQPVPQDQRHALRPARRDTVVVDDEDLHAVGSRRPAGRGGRQDANAEWAARGVIPGSVAALAPGPRRSQARPSGQGNHPRAPRCPRRPRRATLSGRSVAAALAGRSLRGVGGPLRPSRHGRHGPFCPDATPRL